MCRVNAFFAMDSIGPCVGDLGAKRHIECVYKTIWWSFILQRVYRASLFDVLEGFSAQKVK